MTNVATQGPARTHRPQPTQPKDDNMNQFEKKLLKVVSGLIGGNSRAEAIDSFSLETKNSRTVKFELLGGGLYVQVDAVHYGVFLSKVGSIYRAKKIEAHALDVFMRAMEMGGTLVARNFPIMNFHVYIPYGKIVATCYSMPTCRAPQRLYKRFHPAGLDLVKFTGSLPSSKEPKFVVYGDGEMVYSRMSSVVSFAIRKRSVEEEIVGHVSTQSLQPHRTNDATWVSDEVKKMRSCKGETARGIAELILGDQCGDKRTRAVAWRVPQGCGASRVAPVCSNIIGGNMIFMAEGYGMIVRDGYFQKEREQ